MQDKFIVYCERIKKQSRYEISSYFNIQLNERIKSLVETERKFNSEKKVWELSTIGLYTLIQSYRNSDKIHFSFQPDTKKIFIDQVKIIKQKELEKNKRIKELSEKKKYWVKFKENLESEYDKYIEITHKNLKENIKLYPYQVASVIFSNEVRNVLLALDMGTGKSLVSIALVEMNQFQRVFVITPNSLKHNYYNEVEKFTNSKAHIVGWNKNKFTIDEAKYIIVNYEFFNTSDKKKMDMKFKKLNVGKIDALILDESHRIKESKISTTKNIKRIFSNKVFKNSETCKVFMTGTPMQNRAIELYTVLHEISPLDFPTKKFFEEYYLARKYDPNSENEYDKYINNGSQEKFFELYQNISPFIYRKKKSDVLKDLPDKTYQKIVLDMSPSELKKYNEIEKGVADDLFKEGTSPNALTIMLRLRQYTSQLKAKYINEIIDQVINSGDKIIIIDTFKEVLKELYLKYPNVSVLHTGDGTVEQRSEMVKQFQDPDSEIKIFLATVQTANYGLTLTAANKMLILTLPYTVGEYDQVSDRCHRIGQKNNVHIMPTIFSETIDEYVYRLIEKKRTEIMAVLDNETYISNANESTLGDVLQYLKEKYNK